jgi:MFS family permease
MRIAEPEHRRDGKGIGWGTFHIFRKKSLWALLFFSIIYAVVSFGVESVLSFWFAVPALAFTEQALGVQSLGRNCGRAVGALAQSRLSQFLSRRNLVVLGLAGLSVHTILFAFITGQTSAMIVGILFGISVGWLDALACSMAMDESDPDWPGSSFALIMAFQNLGTLGSGLMSTLADSQGFKAAFLIVAAINIFAIAAWPWLDHLHKKPTTDEVWSV